MKMKTWVREVRRGHIAGALALATGALALSPSACSVVVDGSAVQCSSDEDCTGEGFEATRCIDSICKTPEIGCVNNVDCAALPGASCIDSLCVAGEDTCATTAECIAANGENFICKKPVRGARSCVSLLSEDCTLVEGDYESEDAVFIGSVLPIGEVNDDTGVSSQNGARLALQEIQGNAGGLPAISGGAGRRPVVLVSCNDGSDKDTAVRAATYLTDTIGVQAIIGASFSGISLGVANEVTIPRGVLLFSPSATSVALTDLADQDPACLAACAGDADCEAGCPGLFWRSSPNDEFQSAALAAYMPLVEDRIRAELELTASDEIKVMMLHKGDSYGQGIATELESQLEINGETAASQTDTNYQRFNYGDPDNPGESPLKYGDAITRAKALEAHVIFVLGTTEGVEEIISPLEAQWPDLGLAYKPIYIMGDGGFISAIEELVDAQSGTVAQDDLRSRMRGSVPGTSAAANPLFSTFVNTYQSTFDEGSPNTFGAAGGYDIAYLIAFGMTSAAALPLTGTNIARGLVRTAPPGTEIRVGPANLNTGFGVMSNPDGGNMNFQGASGPLDFDVKTGEAISDILIWCMRKNAAGKSVRQGESGLLYSAANLELVGEESNCN